MRVSAEFGDCLIPAQPVGAIKSQRCNVELAVVEALDQRIAAHVPGVLGQGGDEGELVAGKLYDVTLASDYGTLVKEFKGPED